MCTSYSKSFTRAVNKNTLQSKKQQKNKIKYLTVSPPEIISCLLRLHVIPVPTPIVRRCGGRHVHRARGTFCRTRPAALHVHRVAKGARRSPAKLPDDGSMVAALASLRIVGGANLPATRHAHVREDKFGATDCCDFLVPARPRRCGVRRRMLRRRVSTFTTKTE